MTRRRARRLVAAALASAGIVSAVALVAKTKDDPGGSRGFVVRSGADGDAPTTQRRADELRATAKAAGCMVRQFVSEGRAHISDGTAVKYKTSPPTSGNHARFAAPDGVYPPGNPPPTSSWVHSLEHGRVVFQYRRRASRPQVRQLEGLGVESFDGSPPGYHTLVLENRSRMRFAVAAVAWTRSITCERFGSGTTDALRVFRVRYVDNAPEQVR